MKKNYFLIIFTIITLTLSGQQWQWAKGINIPLPYLQGVQISAETSGNFFVSGYKWDQNYGWPAGSCVIKYNSNGNELWRKYFYDKLMILKIQTDNLGNLLIAGDFKDTLTIDNNNYYAQSNVDGFLLSINTNGSINWFQNVSGPGDENVQDIYISKNGDLIATGCFSDKTKIDDQLMNTNALGSTFIAKMNSSGSLLSLITTSVSNSGNSNAGYRLQTDDDNNIYLLGNFNDIKIDTFSLSDYNPYGAQYLAKFDSTGKILFLKQVMSGTEKFKNFRVNSTGLYFTGDGGWTTGGWTKTQKFSDGGNLLWTKTHNGFYYEYSSNNIVETGGGFYTIGMQGDSNLPSWQTIYSLMLSNFDPNGQEHCTFINSTGRIDGYDITAAGVNEFIIVGYTPDTVAFGNFTLTKNDGNIFITKFKSDVSFLAEKIKSTEKFDVIPNPSSGEFLIRLNEQAEEIKICVYDNQGKCVFTRQIRNKTSHAIDLADKPKGIYFIEVISGMERSGKKIILN